MNSPQEKISTDFQGHKTKLNAAIGTKAVNSEVNKSEKTIPELKFCGSHRIYSNHHPDIISTAQSDKNQIKKDENIEKLHRYSKI